ncbi:hypothetical protein BD324DRAFT_639522 [Kockovaella imperatae]|uniref:Uncharacterized protein n=1 Tax=Kockovaella imperatae TaxID=4999 RepID=A0A1Y1U623_9TREE|nr:hypothetical protein BD324DRAFT_639522 [Kockovaella imperatae]ORX33479.1 hypothetical protein BD324DRAFT_639522 [Kockovaella imperatae]
MNLKPRYSTSWDRAAYGCLDELTFMLNDPQVDGDVWATCNVDTVDEGRSTVWRWRWLGVNADGISGQLTTYFLSSSDRGRTDIAQHAQSLADAIKKRMFRFRISSEGEIIGIDTLGYIFYLVNEHPPIPIIETRELFYMLREFENRPYIGREVSRAFRHLVCGTAVLQKKVEERRKLEEAHRAAANSAPAAREPSNIPPVDPRTGKRVPQERWNEFLAYRKRKAEAEAARALASSGSMDVDQ